MGRLGPYTPWLSIVLLWGFHLLYFIVPLKRDVGYFIDKDAVEHKILFFCDDKKFYFSFEMFWHVWHESVAWNRNPPVPFKLVYRSVNVTIKLIYWNCLSFTVWRSLPDTTKEMEVLQIFVKLVNSAAANISPVISQHFQSPPNHISSWFKAELSGQNCSISRPRCHAKGKY